MQVIEKLIATLKMAKEEIEWWEDNHGCCSVADGMYKDIEDVLKEAEEYLKHAGEYAEPRDVLMAFGVDVLVKSGSYMREADLAVIADRYAAQPPAKLVACEFFAYDPECGFETFKTEAEAKKYAQDSIDSYREEASEGWPELVNNVCWGVVLGTTREVALPDEYNGGNGLADYMKPVDYVLTTAQPTVQQQAVAVPDSTYERKRFAKWFCMQDALKEDDASMDGYWAGWLARSMQPPAVPDGYALVPIEPTPEMSAAGCAIPLNKAARHNAVYRAMLAAAPQAAAGESSVVQESEVLEWLVNWLKEVGLLQNLICQPSAGAQALPYWILRRPLTINGGSCEGYGSTPIEAIAAAQKGNK